MSMKKYLVAILALLFWGCTIDDLPKYEPFLASISGVELPETLIHGETYAFPVQYIRANSCDVFSGFDHIDNGNEQLIGVINRYYPEVGDCGDGVFNAEIDFEFIVDRNDFYIFKFWQGADENGDPEYLTIEVQVEQ